MRFVIALVVGYVLGATVDPVTMGGHVFHLVGEMKDGYVRMQEQAGELGEDN